MILNCSISLEDQPKVFLARLWRDLPCNNQELVGLCYDKSFTDHNGNKITYIYPEWQYIDQLGTGYDLSTAYKTNLELRKLGNGSVFYQLASRKTEVLQKHNARGTYDQLGSINCLAVDIDTAENGIDDPTNVLNNLLLLPYKPSIVVYTGGGLQALWFFDSPLSVEDRPRAEYYKNLSSAFAHKVSNVIGIKFDYSVNEPTRILRLPGFINNKPKRNGAMAEIAYFSMVEYSLGDLVAYAPITAKNEPILRHIQEPEQKTDHYLVGKSIVDYLINNYKTTARHPTLTQLAINFAESSVPKDLTSIHLKKLAKKWFTEAETHRTGHELESLINWAYDHVTGFNSNYIKYRVYIDPETIKIAELQDSDQDTEYRLTDQQIFPVEGTISNVPTYDLAALRSLQKQTIDEYLLADHNRIASALILRTSPGSGKTTQTLLSALQIVQSEIDKGISARESNKKILFLTQFKMDDPQGIDFLSALGINKSDYPSNMFYFFSAREGNPDSKGFCSQAENANILGSKRYDIIHSLCSHCPLFQECSDKYYLSQFKKLNNSWIVFARYQHGFISDMIKDREIVIIDENFSSVITTPINVKPHDLRLNFAKISPIVQDQNSNELAILDSFLTILREIIENNEAAQYFGFWLIESLISKSKSLFEAFLGLPKNIISSSQVVDITDQKTILESQPKFITHLQNILEYEYDLYLQGVKEWNSRLIPINKSLNIYPVEPLAFNKKAKVIVCDATTDPSIYYYLLSDKHTEKLDSSEDEKTNSKRVKRYRPRQLNVFDAQLDHKSITVQLVGTQNSKATVFRGIDLLQESPVVSKSLSRIKIDNFIKKIKEFTNPALANSLEIIYELAKKHPKKLLIVTYKKLIGSDNKDNRGVIGLFIDKLPDEIRPDLQWFGNLRGKNNWKDYSAVIVLGTPRIDLDSRLITSQVLNWRDSQVINSTQGYKTLQYPNTGYLYQYLGYEDQRLNTAYLNEMIAEIRQCTDRIRPNSSADTKYIYLATSLPYTDKVDHLHNWQSYANELRIESILNKYMQAEQAVTIPYLLAEIASKLGCSESTARRLYTYQLNNGFASNGKHFKDIFKVESFGGKNWLILSDSTVLEDKITLFGVSSFLEWLQAQKPLSIDQLKDKFSNEYPNLADKFDIWINFYKS